MKLRQKTNQPARGNPKTGNIQKKNKSSSSPYASTDGLTLLLSPGSALCPTLVSLLAVLSCSSGAIIYTVLPKGQGPGECCYSSKGEFHRSNLHNLQLYPTPFSQEQAYLHAPGLTRPKFSMTARTPVLKLLCLIIILCCP